MVNKDRIRAFVTSLGTIVGEDDSGQEDGIIILKHPFRIMPMQDGRVAVAALFNKEEWCKFNSSFGIEINITDGISDMYCDYESQLHGSIIQVPDAKIIL
jgi:hypothetical protein